MVAVAPLPPPPSVQRVNQNLTPTQAQIDYERKFAAWVAAIVGSGGSGSIPFPTLTTIGGVKAATAPAHQFQRGIDTSGNPLFAQPAAGDISGLGPFATASSIAVGSITGLGSLATLSSIDLASQATGNLGITHLNSGIDANSSHFWRGDGTWATPTALPGGSSGQVQFNSAGAFGGFTVGGDGTLDPTTGVLTVTKTSGVPFATVATSGSASDLGTGTLPAARLPNPSATTLGGVRSYAAVSNQWINSISTSGVPSSTQPSAADLSDGNVGTGAIAHAANPSFTGTAVFQTISASTAGVTTATIVTANVTTLNATTGTIATLTAPNVSGAFAKLTNTTNTGQLALSGTGNDNGGYILGYSTNTLDLAGGALFNGTNWIAKDTTANLLTVSGGVFGFYSDTGLTIGNTFGPTIRFGADATGTLTNGTVPAARTSGFAPVATSGSAADLSGTLASARLAGQFYGSVNKFRNGTMDVWQRGTGSITVATAGAYVADGWIVTPTGASCTAAQSTGKLLTVNSLQVTGATSVTDITVKQRVESNIAAPLTSQTVTVQAQVFNSTGGSITPALTVKHANAADNWAATTTDVSAVSLQACANSAWTQVAYTFAAAAATGNGLEITFDFGNNFSTTGKSLKIAELDIRVTPGVTTGLNGSAPVPELRPYPIEMTFSQRYYFAGPTIQINTVSVNGSVYTIQVFFPVAMRTTPAVTQTNAGGQVGFAAGTNQTNVSNLGFLSYRVSNAGNNSAVYAETFIANAEL